MINIPSVNGDIIVNAMAEPYVLPTNAVQTDSVEFTGKEFMPTGVTASSNTRIVVDFKPTVENSMAYFGTFNTAEDSDYRLFVVNGITYLDITTSRIQKSIANIINARHIVEFGNAYYKFTSYNGDYDPVEVTGTVQNTVCPAEICVSNIYTPASMVVYSMQIYDGDVKVRDFVPYQIGDEKCFYDLVTERVYVLGYVS